MSSSSVHDADCRKRPQESHLAPLSKRNKGEEEDSRPSQHSSVSLRVPEVEFEMEAEGARGTEIPAVANRGRNKRAPSTRNASSTPPVVEEEEEREESPMLKKKVCDCDTLEVCCVEDDVDSVSLWVPWERDSVPLGGDSVPLGGDSVPLGGDSVPLGGDSVPLGGDSVPLGGDSVPLGGDSVPLGGDSVPLGGDSVPLGEGQCAIGRG